MRTILRRDNGAYPLRGRTVHLFEFLKTSKKRIVADFATLLFSLIFAVLNSTDKQLKHCIAQNFSKKGNFAEPATKFVKLATKFAESGTVCETINKS